MSGASFEITPAFIYDVWLQRAAVAAGYSLLVYDYFITLGDEVECIWNVPWTPVKSVYLANRYTVLLGQTVICIQETGAMAAISGGCKVYAIFLGVYTLVSLETAHVLVVLRAWAIWGGNRLILRSVVLGYVACLISLIVAVGKGADFSSFEPSVKSVCYEPAPDRAWLFYFGSLVVDSLFFCMTMSGLWTYRKSFSHGSLGLIKALMRDVTIFYIVNVCYDVLGIVCMTTYQNSPIAFAVSGIMSPVLAICTQRVVHDLRRMAPVEWSPQELSDAVNQQLEAFPFWAQSADDGASMALDGISAVDGETASDIDEISVAADDDTELQPDDDAGISVGIPSFDSRSYSPASEFVATTTRHPN
ncbi:hypothetical protein EV401DRAFT_2176818 [Pisolithus croceorrhizus]|nr:hypothetical protein EV401DRAFT_2176818 [Pisolithus croceorrhizus]